MSNPSELADLSGLSLERLRTLVAIADAGGLARAAGGDPNAMSQFSRQLKELEAFFGTELMTKRGRLLVLTESGRDLVRLARETLDGLASFRVTHKEFPQIVALGAGNSLIEWWLVPRLAKLHDAFPRIRFIVENIRSADAVRRVGESTLDLAIVRGDAVLNGLESRPLCKVRYDLFVPPRLAKKIDARNPLAGLPGVPLALSAGGQFREKLREAAEASGVRLDVAVECASFTQAARFVKAGAAAAFLPRMAAADFGEKDAVRFEAPLLSTYVRPLELAWNPRHVASRKWLVLVIDALVATGDAARGRAPRGKARH